MPLREKGLSGWADSNLVEHGIYVLSMANTLRRESKLREGVEADLR